jgi:hypothetical protein
MHPYMLEGVARERIADMHRVAAAHRLVREAAAGEVRAPRTRWIGGRRHHRVELVWPDGVSSVVELPRTSVSARHEGRGLAGSRR